MKKSLTWSALSLAASLLTGAGLLFLLNQTALAYDLCDPSKLTNLIPQPVSNMDSFHGNPPREIPDGWTEFILSGNPTYQPDGHTFYGEPSLGILSKGVPFTAGILTQVPVTPGAGYRASISWGAPSHPDETGRQLGIDPAGGTDPNSPTVIWGPMHWGPARRLNYEPPDVNIDVKARAAGETLTVFFRVEHPTATANSQIYIDAIALCPDESAQGDVTPPTLLDLDIDPPQIDTSNGPATLTVSARFVDDLSGFDSAGISFRSLVNTTEQVYVPLQEQHRIAGETGIPIVSNTFTLPHSAAQGRWIATELTMTDTVGNHAHYSRTVPNGQWSLPNYYFVNGQDDISPPTLLDLDIAPPRIDTSNGPASVTVSARFGDDLSGFDSAGISFQPLVTTTEQVYVPLQEKHRITGTLGFPIYYNTFTLPRAAAQGRWIATQLTMTDTVGDRVHYSRTVSSGQWPLPNYYFINGQDDAHMAFLPHTSAASVQNAAPDESLFFNTASVQRCDPNAGITYVEGKTYINGQPANGYLVAFSFAADGSVVATIESGPHEGYPGWDAGYYSHILRSNGPREGNWFFWIVDDAGHRISKIAELHTDSLAGEGKCQQAVIDFDADR